VIGLIVLALGAVAVIVPVAASQDAPSGARWVPRNGVSSKDLTPQAVSDAFTTNDNFFTLTYNHFGSPSLGSVVAETWMESGFDDTGTAVNLQGFTRAILLPKAVRVAIRVDLHGITASNDDVIVARSSTVNSAGRLTVQVATPEIFLPTETRCFFYTVVHAAIRWSDGRLSSVAFQEPIAFTPGPTGCSATQ
jgi:hypothetical protein